MDVKALDKNYIANTYVRFPIEIKKGKGATIIDSQGKQYIDMSTGIAVNTFGLCDKAWKKAVKKQMACFQHTSNLFFSEPSVTLAKLLCEKTGLKKVFFSNSGAEANECAIKVARKFGSTNKGKDCYKILTLKNSFHGRTITTLSATGQDVFHKDFTPFTEGFIYAEANNIADLEQKVNENGLCAIMFEIVQGEGGVTPLTQEFVDKMVSLAKEKDLLLIADEVQIGNGRSGKLYGYMNYGFTPDIITTAKGLGGGLPIGATMLNERVENVLTYGDHGSTFGANPLACAGAISIINRLDDNLLNGVREKSKKIIDTLSGKEGIKSVSGLGLMLGIETELDASEVIKRCHEKGVLVIKAKNKVRLLPPLNISDKLLEKALSIILECAKN